MNSKGIVDNTDYNKEPGEFEKCPDGKYSVTAIEWIWQEDNFPIMKPAGIDKGLKAMLRLIRADGGIAPAYMTDAVGLRLLVRAFGGDLGSVAFSPATATAFLIAVEEAIKKGSKKDVKVTVKNGFAKSIQGATPQEGNYRVKWVRARTPDGTEPLQFVDNGFGNPVIFAFFEIVGSLMGNPTPYDGYQFMKSIENAFDGHENNMPKVLTTASGAPKKAWLRMKNLVRCFAPDVFEDHVWLPASQSPLGIDEWTNPIAVIWHEAQQESKVVTCMYVMNGQAKPPRPDIDLLMFNPLEGSISVTDSAGNETDTKVSPIVPNSGIPDLLVEFFNWVHTQCPDGFSTTPIHDITEVSLSPAGQKWAGEQLPAIFTTAQVAMGRRPLREITEEEAGKLMGVIWGTNNATDAFS